MAFWTAANGAGLMGWPVASISDRYISASVRASRSQTSSRDSWPERGQMNV
jgi:hypothetical protein